MESALDRLKNAKVREEVELAEPVKLPDLEQRVYDFIGASKFIGESNVPIYGATTVEVAAAFPEINTNYLRRVVWNLRQKGLLVDKGVRRNLEKGKCNLAVWFSVGENKG